MPSSRSIREALARFLAERWEHLLAQREMVLRNPGVDQIHDLRVSSRRLRAVIEQLELFPGAGPVRRIRRPVRRLTGLLGELRNLDEARLYFEQGGLHGLEPLLADLAQQRCRRVAAVSDYLERFDVLKTGRHIQAAVTALAALPAAQDQDMLALLSERNLRLYHPIHELLADTTGADRVEQRHRLRIAVKKWRYFTELLERILGNDQGSLLEQLRRYQGILGKMNDLQVFRALLTQSDSLAALPRLAALEQVDHRHVALLAEYLELTSKEPLHYLFLPEYH